MKRYSVTVPASTANLGAGVDCLGLALGRYLSVRLREADTVTVRRTEGFCDRIPEEKDCFLAAVRRVYRETGRPFLGVDADMQTEIPLARGLGSSAAAIVAGALGANALLGFPLTQEKLLDIAADMEGHPDNVLPALLGGFTAGMRENGHVRYVQNTVSPALRLVAAIPGFRLSTEKARAVLPDTLLRETAVGQLQRACVMTQALRTGDAALIAAAAEDRIFTPARRALIPGYDAVQREAGAAGAFAVMISGAGPTLLAITDAAHAEDTARAMERGFRTAGVDAAAAVLFADERGARLEESSCDI